MTDDARLLAAIFRRGWQAAPWSPLHVTCVRFHTRAHAFFAQAPSLQLRVNLRVSGSDGAPPVDLAFVPNAWLHGSLSPSDRLALRLCLEDLLDGLAEVTLCWPMHDDLKLTARLLPRPAGARWPSLPTICE